ncbi:DUF1254 domain-containing protein [Pseudomonas sp. TH39(2020)]|uniref:DUF1254 domain-containing protein n=1 Tax=Pseudomonas sp. TH39(2020) TaxID=2796349 RepID=UPI001F5B74C4|nr:DUF1254 domain-containing protein [Pseudomonas sp. TH39(2020)]
MLETPPLSLGVIDDSWFRWATDTAIVTPNSDTLYSVVWADLRAEPMVQSVSAAEKSRYYSVMLCDGNTFSYGYISSRATGSEAGKYLTQLEGRNPALCAGPTAAHQRPSGR